MGRVFLCTKDRGWLKSEYSRCAAAIMSSRFVVLAENRSYRMMSWRVEIPGRICAVYGVLGMFNNPENDYHHNRVVGHHTTARIMFCI